MQVKKFTQEDIDNYLGLFPYSKPRQYALVDDDLDGGLVIEFHDTEEAARTALEDWTQTDLVEDALRDAVRKIAEEVGIDVAKVAEIAKGFF